MTAKRPYLATSASSGNESSPTLPDWREIAVIVLERAWIAITVAVIVFLVFWFNAVRETPYFRSTASLIVEAQGPQLLNFQDGMAVSSRNLEYFNTHVLALHSRKMMEEAIRVGNLADRTGFTPGTTSTVGQAEMALRMVSITPVERSRMINITAEHAVPEIAADLANALANAYRQQDLDARMSASLQAVEWLRTRADEYREKVAKGLLELQQYREKTQSVSLEEDQNIVIAKLKALNSALTQAQTERIEVEAQWKGVEVQMASDVERTAIAAMLDDPLVRDALQRQQEQERKIRAMGQRYREGHPDYKEAEEELAGFRRHFVQVCDQSIQVLRRRYELLLERERSLQQALETQEQAAFDLDRKLVRYNDLKRYVEAEQDIYQAVIGRMKESSLAGTMPTERIQIVEDARAASAPFRPNRRQAALRGGGFGLLLGLAAIFVFYYLDNRLRRAEDVERHLAVPVLGSLPLMFGKSMEERGMIVHKEDTGIVAEAFRTLRTALMMTPAARKQSCLMVSSAHAGEGKSLIATNLAISFAQDGQRTLLIGADLRRPSLHLYFGAESKAPGLTEVLKDGVEWRSVLLKHDVADLDVLPAGGMSRRPAELLGSRRFGELLEELKTQYDRIVLDAPPVLLVSDALILLSHVDSVLFVVRSGVTHQLSARHALTRLRSGSAPIVGAVINGINLRSISNYCYHRYGGYAYVGGQSERGLGRGKKE